MGKQLIQFLKKTSDRYFLVICNCLILVFCMCTFFPLGAITNYFRGECILYAEPSIARLTVSKTNVTKITLNVKTTVWGQTSTCYYTTYASVVVAIYIFIWLWFRIQLRTKVYDNRYILTAMVIGGVMNLILFIILFITSCLLVAGSTHLCKHIEETLKERNILFSVVKSFLKKDNVRYEKCSDTQAMLWSVYKDGKVHQWYNYLQLAQVSSWITLVILGVQIVFNVWKIWQFLSKKDNSDSQTDTDSIDGSDEDVNEISYRHHMISEDTGSIRFHYMPRHPSQRSDEEFLLPL